MMISEIYFINEVNTPAMFKFLFTMFGKKLKDNQNEYTPDLEFYQQIHDETEGSEFLDDAVEFEETTPSAKEKDDPG
jgi:hypothetical protein